MSPWYFHNTAGGDSNDRNSQYGNDCDTDDNDDTKSGREMLAVIVVYIMLRMIFNMVFNIFFHLVFNMVVTNLSNSFTSSRDIPSAALVWR